MYPTILVPLEESAQAKRAVPFATRLAAAGKGRLVLMRAIPDPDLRSHAEEMLGGIANDITARRVRVETYVYVGDPGRLIVEEAERVRTDLIAMATDRWTDLDRWLNGSVVDWVLRHTSVPIFVVPPYCTGQWRSDRAPGILIPLDGSHLAEESLKPAVALGRILDCDILLVRAIDGPEHRAAAQAYLDAVAARLTSQDARAAGQVIIGDAASAIAGTVSGANVGMIVMATHGRTALARLVLGSVATRVLHDANVPLVLVRPTALQTATAGDSRGVLERSGRSS